MLQLRFLQLGRNLTCRSFSIKMSQKELSDIKFVFVYLGYDIIWNADTMHVDTKILWLILGIEKYLLDKFYRQVAGLSIRPILYYCVTVVFVFWIVI